MEDRIEINGEWYVKENSLKSENKKIGFDKLTTDELTFVSKIIYEESNYLIEFSILDYNNEYCMPSLYIKNKLTNKSEVWDSEEFIYNLLNDNIDSDIMETMTIVNDYELHVIKEMLKFAEEKEYI